MRFLDAGESHGKGLVAILEGYPANVDINIDDINLQLARRQKGFGRGKRMQIESDKIEVLSGVRGGKTTGAPIAIAIFNKDYENWKDVMNIENQWLDKVTVPRPGHADLNGVLKYNLDDVRNVSERASARETSIRVAIGAISLELLKIFGVKIVSRVVRIGNIIDETSVDMLNISNINRIEESPVRCFDYDAERRMIDQIQDAMNIGDTLGGTIEVNAFNVPCGLGSHVSFDRKFDYSAAGALMSVQGVKVVEIGEGVLVSGLHGSSANDGIIINNGKFERKTNFSGGIEGGITTGMPLLFRISMKPIPTVKLPLDTVDLSGNIAPNRYERSDTCSVPALGVVCENVISFEIAKHFLEKFSGDSIEDIKNSYDFYMDRLSRR